MENLTYYGQLEGLSRKRSFARAEEVMGLLGLTSEKTKRARHLSGGQKRRLHSGMAIMHEPKVIFMDEPTVGADVEARSRILHAMQSLAKNGAAIIYTSHYLAEFEELGADIAIIHNGRIAAEGSLEKIIANYARSSVSLQFSQPVPSIDGWQSNGVELLRENNANDAGSAIADLLANPALKENTLENVQISQASLQSAYLSIVGEETNHDTLKKFAAIVRLNIRLQLMDPTPTLILSIFPLVMIPFMEPAFKSMLLSDGYTNVTGVEQAIPGMAIFFSF